MITIISSTKGSGMVCQTEALIQHKDDFLDLQRQYDIAQSEFTADVLEATRTYLPAFTRLSERIGVVDVLCAFAVVAADSSVPYVRPGNTGFVFMFRLLFSGWIKHIKVFIPLI